MTVKLLIFILRTFASFTIFEKNVSSVFHLLRDDLSFTKYHITLNSQFSIVINVELSPDDSRKTRSHAEAVSFYFSPSRTRPAHWRRGGLLLPPSFSLNLKGPPRKSGLLTSWHKEERPGQKRSSTGWNVELARPSASIRIRGPSYRFRWNMVAAAAMFRWPRVVN